MWSLRRRQATLEMETRLEVVNVWKGDREEDEARFARKSSLVCFGDASSRLESRSEGAFAANCIKPFIVITFRGEDISARERLANLFAAQHHPHCASRSMAVSCNARRKQTLQ